MLNRILNAYNKHISSEEYQQLTNNEKLVKGKSADVFYSDVVNRVKLEYMGAVNDNGACKMYSVENGGIKSSYSKTNLKDLIVPNSTLKDITRLYAEYGTNKSITETVAEGKEEFVHKFDFQKDTTNMMILQSWAGKFLIKGAITEKDFSYYTVKPLNYFGVPNIYNEEKIDAYVIFHRYTEDTSTTKLKTEIYTEDSIEYRCYKLIENKDSQSLEEIQYPDDLTTNGMTKEGLGYKDMKAKGWGVTEVTNIFESSDYDSDTLAITREIIVGDTISSQAFQKIANPILQVPDSMLEIDADGKGRVRLDDRIVMMGRDDKEIKQVQVQSQINEWKVQRDMYEKKIFRSEGVNDLAFGTSEQGDVASGEAKKRSLERTIATVESKRARVLKGIENIVKWGYMRIHGQELDFGLQGQDVLSISLKEKLEIATMGINAGIMSVETAIEYINIQNEDIEDELKRIKQDLSYKNKLAELINKLMSVTRDVDLQEQVEHMTDDLLKELGLNTTADEIIKE